MQSWKNFADKNRLSRMILTGAVVMLFVFIISLFLPKKWQVSGKIVVFPSGQPAIASQNLVPEIWNTAEIINSAAFQKENFGAEAANFAGASVLKNSSMVWVKFRSSESDVRNVEDLIVKVPSQVNDFSRDLYGGSPFKYKLVSDPEISASPVRPNLLLNAIFGFLAGIVLYLLFWLGIASRRPVVEDFEVEEEKATIVSPEIKAEEPAEVKKAGKGKVEMIDGRPHFVPNKMEGAKSSAPENLPFVDEAAPSFDSNLEEPSDEEVKERLNKLMRGEL
ncbi:MAG TPA: hypothetical protein VK254_00800 [Candidatus Bathyarchaeia archaeon]|nr:hypothetical protein [Candidatus Bathyarchaeia archaeon]